MGLKKWIQKQKLKQASARSERQKVLKNLAEVKSVFVVKSMHTMQELEKWNQYFLQSIYDHIKTDWVGFLSMNEKELPAHLPPNVYTTKDLDLFGFPKNNSKKVANFKKKYDLAIDLNFDDVYLLNSFLINVNSGLRIGSDVKKAMFDFYDLTISTKDPINNPKLFIDQVFYFLDNINK